MSIWKINDKVKLNKPGDDKRQSKFSTAYD